jgi:hypothetical protein
MSRGVLYIVWGDKPKGVLDRSIVSVGRLHPELPVEVKTLDDGSLLDKAKMLSISPFDETLFLDADAVVLERLDYGFSAAREHGVACSICENPWACRYPSIKGDTVEYNTGVMFFTKTQRTQSLFGLWESMNNTIDSSITWEEAGIEKKMAHNDQCGFAAACFALGFHPYVLPMNWNFRPKWHRTWWGSIKVWHDYSDPYDMITGRKPMEYFSSV